MGDGWTEAQRALIEFCNSEVRNLTLFLMAVMVGLFTLVNLLFRVRPLAHAMPLLRYALVGLLTLLLTVVVWIVVRMRYFLQRRYFTLRSPLPDFGVDEAEPNPMATLDGMVNDALVSSSPLNRLCRWAASPLKAGPSDVGWLLWVLLFYGLLVVGLAIASLAFVTAVWA